MPEEKNQLKEISTLDGLRRSLLYKPTTEPLFYQIGKKKEDGRIINDNDATKYVLDFELREFSNDTLLFKHPTKNIKIFFENLYTKRKKEAEELIKKIGEEIKNNEITIKKKLNLLDINDLNEGEFKLDIDDILDRKVNKLFSLLSDINLRQQKEKNWMSEEEKNKALEEVRVLYKTAKDFSNKQEVVGDFLKSLKVEENSSRTFSKEKNILNQIPKTIKEIEGLKENNSINKNQITELKEKLNKVKKTLTDFQSKEDLEDKEKRIFKETKESIKDSLKNIIHVNDNTECFKRIEEGLKDYNKEEFEKEEEAEKTIFYIVQDESHWYSVIQSKNNIMVIDPSLTDGSSGGKDLKKKLNKLKELNVSINLEKIQKCSGCCEFYAIDLIFLLSKIQYFSNFSSIFDIFEEKIIKQNKSLDLPKIFYRGLSEEPFNYSKKIVSSNESKSKKFDSLNEYEKHCEAIMEERIKLLEENRNFLLDSERSSVLKVSEDKKLERLFLENTEHEIAFLQSCKSILIKQHIKYLQKYKNEDNELIGSINKDDGMMIKGGYMYNRATTILLQRNIELNEKELLLKNLILEILKLQKRQDKKEVQDDSFLAKIRKERIRNSLSERPFTI